MNTALWVIRLLFSALCILGGYAVSQVRPDVIENGYYGVFIGFGLGGVLIAIDEMLKGFSLRAFSAATFGLMLGSLVAFMVDRSQLFIFAPRDTLWLVRVCLFLCFGYIGMVLAMRSNKEDFSLIIPFVRFTRENAPLNLILLDTSVIIDGRIADLIEANFVEGVIIIPRFVLKELQAVADSTDTVKRAKGQRGLEILSRLRRNKRHEVKIHEGDIPGETEVDSKLVQLAQTLNAKLYTNDQNLAKVAELQSVSCINLNAVSQALKPVIIPGDIYSVRLAREGKEKGQGVGYLNDGTMVVVNQGQHLIGQQVRVQVLSLLQTGAGVIVFANYKETETTPV